MARLERATVVIKAAAVADYRPAVCQATKIKKKAGPLTVCLERNPDILAEIGKKKGHRIVVGFSMESDHLLEHARTKLMEKGMDFIVANDVTEAGAGFGTDTNIVRILDREGGVETFPLMDKLEVAGVILDRVKKITGRWKDSGWALKGNRGKNFLAWSDRSRRGCAWTGSWEDPSPISSGNKAAVGAAAGRDRCRRRNRPARKQSALEAVRAALGDCRRCPLHRTRHRLVFGEGNPAGRAGLCRRGAGGR